jgi:hypothetical protein
VVAIAALPRDRGSVERDLRAALHACGRLGDSLEQRELTVFDVTGIDAMLRGISRCLAELRASRAAA